MKTTNRLAIVTVVLTGLSTFATPASAQDQKKAPLIVGIVIDGTRILVEFDGDAVKATADGQKLPSGRIEKRGNLVIVKDSESHPVFYVRILPTGGSIYRVARSNKAAIGVEIKPLSKALADHLDLNPNSVIYVTRAIKGRAADRGGLRDHDVIIGIDGESPVSEKILTRVLAKKKPGDRMKVRVIRRGKESNLTIKCERAKAASRFQYAFSSDGRTAFNQGNFGFFYDKERYDTNLSSAIKSLDLLKKNMSKGKAYDQYKKDFDKARKALSNAQKNVNKKSSDYYRSLQFLYDTSSIANPLQSVARAQLFNTKKQGKDDVLLLSPFYRALNPKSGAAWQRIKKPKTTTDLGKKLQHLEKRFDRLEEMLQKLLNKKKN